MPTSSPAAAIDLPAALKREAERVEAYLSTILSARPLPKNLRDATSYGLLGGGKRLRPILTLWSCQAVGGDPEAALPAAAAIELVHCFSLVHDDLPAMDDDDLRRGRPTLHKHTNEAMAILAGDLMSSLAFEVIATRLAPEVAGYVARELAIGTNDMIAGQVYDTLPDFADSVPPLERLKTIHRNKTGALIRCACRMGAIVGSAEAPSRQGAGQGSINRQLGHGESVHHRGHHSAFVNEAARTLPGGAQSESEPLTALTRYGETIGLMFQVVDDLLDVTQTTEHLGKKSGKDADKGKLTYPGLIGIEASLQEVERLRVEAYDALSPLGDNARLLRELCEFMSKRTK